VRISEIGEAQHLTPSITLPTPAQLFPDTTMRISIMPRAGAEIPCVVITPLRVSPPLQCPLIVYTDLNGFICKIQKEPSHQESRGERFSARLEGPPIR
jgi:hypothetical protein